jgi:hypothetical protein
MWPPPEAEFLIRYLKNVGLEAVLPKVNTEINIEQ